MPTLSDECLNAIASKCTKIRNFSALGVNQLTDEAFRNFSQKNKRLQKIKLSQNPKLTDITFKHLAKNCTLEIKYLCITDCQTLTDAALKWVRECKFLTVLNLANCVRISDAGVKSIVESSVGPKLKEMNLSNCVRVGDLSVIAIHRRCQNLSYLSLCYCDHIDHAGIDLLGLICSLTSLDITGCQCTDQGLSALGHNSKIRYLTLSECEQITDLGIQKVAQITALEYLDISHCNLLTDSGIKNLAFSCRMLTNLNISGCKKLTDHSLQYISGVCHYLLVLNLNGLLGLTDKSLKYIKRGCRRLQILYILYCSNMTK